MCNLGSINLDPRMAIADLAGALGATHVLLLLQASQQCSHVITVASMNRVPGAQRLRQRTHDIEPLFVKNGLTAAQLHASLLPSPELPSCPREPTDQGSRPLQQAADNATTAAAGSVAGPHRVAEPVPAAIGQPRIALNQQGQLWPAFASMSSALPST